MVPFFPGGKARNQKDATWRDLDLALRRFNWTSQYGGREAASGPTAGGALLSGWESSKSKRCDMARFGPDTQEIQLDVAVRWPRSGEWPHRRWCPSFRVGKLEIKDATWRDLDLTLRRFNWTSQYGGREAASGPTAGGRGLGVDRHALHRRIRIQHRLTQRRMRMNREHQLIHGAFEFHHRNRLGNQLRRLRPEDVDAQNLAVLGVGHDLYKTIVAVDDRRF